MAEFARPRGTIKIQWNALDSCFVTGCESVLRKRNGSADCSADYGKQRPIAAATLHHTRRGIVQDHLRIFARQKFRRMLQWQEGNCIRNLSNLIVLRNAPATISAARVRTQ